MDNADANWRQLERDEAALLQMIGRLRSERKSLKSEEKRLTRDGARLDHMEQRLFDEYHQFGMELNHASSELVALQQQVRREREGEL